MNRIQNNNNDNDNNNKIKDKKKGESVEERERGLGSAKILWLGLEEASSGYGPCLSCLDIWTNALEHLHLLTSPNCDASLQIRSKKWGCRDLFNGFALNSFKIPL